ncbi:hypothetical protein LTR04_005670 [Oleoguttula sp. CCFEE 6159]|nr:hypothetical protein LTR04_005670 [Oleoguttula sp. CCFEE 6159]
MARSTPRRDTIASNSSSVGSRSSGSDRSYHSQSTAPTDYSTRPTLIHHDTCNARLEGRGRGPLEAQDYDDARASVDTYTSTLPSFEEIAEDHREFEVPEQRHETFATDAVPATPSDFAQLFPSSRKLCIRHDDATFDGNMNLRLDTQVDFSGGRRKNLTLFHLRMHDLRNREYSLRRYCRGSGREVCHTVQKHQKPIAEKRSSFTRSVSNALASLRSKSESKTPTASSLKRADSGYESMNPHDDDEDESRPKSADSPKSASQLPANVTKLEFSNYAQVYVSRRGGKSNRRYEFEYWGKSYAWRRVVRRESSTEETSYDLIRSGSNHAVAHIVPTPMSIFQAREEAAKGGWIPPSEMWISDREVIRSSTDISDIVVATGLIALVDDCIKQRFHSKQSRQLVIPMASLKMNMEYVGPQRLINEVFNRPSARGATPSKQPTPLRHMSHP